MILTPCLASRYLTTVVGDEYEYQEAEVNKADRIPRTIARERIDM